MGRLPEKTFSERISYGVGKGEWELMGGGGGAAKFREMRGLINPVDPHTEG